MLVVLKGTEALALLVFEPSLPSGIQAVPMVGGADFCVDVIAVDDVSDINAASAGLGVVNVFG